MVWWHKADIRCSHFMSVQVQKIELVTQRGWLVSPAYDWGVGPLHLDPSQASSASVVKVLCKDLVAQRIAAHSYRSRCWTFQCRLQFQDIPPKNDQEDNTSKGGNVGTPAAFAKTARSLRICLKKMSRTFGSVRIFLNSSSPAPWLQPQPPKPFQRIHIICIQKQSENVLHTKYWCDYLFYGLPKLATLAFLESCTTIMFEEIRPMCHRSEK